MAQSAKPMNSGTLTAQMGIWSWKETIGCCSGTARKDCHVYLLIKPWPLLSFLPFSTSLNERLIVFVLFILVLIVFCREERESLTRPKFLYPEPLWCWMVQGQSFVARSFFIWFTVQVCGWRSLVDRLSFDWTVELFKKMSWKHQNNRKYIPNSTMAAPIKNRNVIWKSKRNTEAMLDKIIDRDVANPLRMLSAYLSFHYLC